MIRPSHTYGIGSTDKLVSTLWFMTIADTTCQCQQTLQISFVISVSHKRKKNNKTMINSCSLVIWYQSVSIGYIWYNLMVIGLLWEDGLSLLPFACTLLLLPGRSICVSPKNYLHSSNYCSDSPFTILPWWWGNTPKIKYNLTTMIVIIPRITVG